MFGFNFGNNSDEDIDRDSPKNELEQFFEDEDWDIGQKGGEVEKNEEIDWSNYDFMHTFDELEGEKSDQDREGDLT